jgi:hypothetical protein
VWPSSYALNLALSMLVHGPADQQKWRWTAVKALTEPAGPEATKVVNGLLIGSASEAGTADLD